MTPQIRWSHRILVVLLLLMGGATYLLTWGKAHDSPGMRTDGTLAPCRHSNCLSSLENTEYHPPLLYSGSTLKARNNLVRSLQSIRGSNIVVDEGAYIHAEITSYYFNVWHDLEFLISKERVHFRCTSRAGFYGLPLARRRLLELRTHFEGLLNATGMAYIGPGDEGGGGGGGNSLRGF